MVILQGSHGHFEEKEGVRKKKRNESPLPLNPRFATAPYIKPN
jgi:hypothetical protein